MLLTLHSGVCPKTKTKNQDTRSFNTCCFYDFAYNWGHNSCAEAERKPFHLICVLHKELAMTQYSAQLTSYYGATCLKPGVKFMLIVTPRRLWTSSQVHYVFQMICAMFRICLSIMYSKLFHYCCAFYFYLFWSNEAQLGANLCLSYFVFFFNDVVGRCELCP